MDDQRISAALQDLSDDAVSVARADDPSSSVPQIRWCNPAFCNMFGHRKEDFIGSPEDSLFGTHSDPYAIEGINDAYIKKISHSTEVLCYRRDGTAFWVDYRTKPVFNQAGEVEFWLSLRRDISELKDREQEASTALSERVFFEEQMMRAKANAEAAQRRLLDAISALPDAFVIYDTDDKLVVCNSEYLNVYNEVRDHIYPGAKFEDILRAGLAQGQYRDAIGREEEWLAERLYNHSNPNKPHEQVLNGNRYLKVHEKRTESGDIVGCRVDQTEIRRSQMQTQKYADALEKANSDIRRQALHDTLTDLPNRRYLDEHMTQRRKQAKPGIGVALMHIDLDRFKQINDTLGHAAGDLVLTHVSTFLKSTLGEDDFAARIGGDEFVLVVPSEGNEEKLRDIGRNIVSTLARPLRFEGHVCRFGASVGIAVDPDVKLTPEELLVNADVALYRAKETGRGRVAFYTDALHQEVLDRKQTADEILAGLENREFFPVYQPQFDAQSLDFAGVEMLARWMHPVKGILAPGAWGEVADDLGVMGQIEGQLLDHVKQDLAAFQSRGSPIPKVSFNVVASRILDPKLGRQLASLMDYGTRASVELLESMSLDQLDPKMAFAIDQLKDQGLTIEIDDFGSCRASIVALLNVSPTSLKIDQQLIIPMLTSDTQRKLVHAIIEIGRALGINVVAEGVETLRHCEVLSSMGCDVLQGYALARPMMADALKDFLIEEPWRPENRETG